MWAVMASSSWLTDGMSTSSAVAASRSVAVLTLAHAVLAEDVVERGLVVALALGEAADDQARTAYRTRRRGTPWAGWR